MKKVTLPKIIPFLFNRPSTCLGDAEHTYALLKSFAGLWRTSNKYKLCPTKITQKSYVSLLKKYTMDHQTYGHSRNLKT